MKNILVIPKKINVKISFSCFKLIYSSADNAVIDLSYKNMRRSEPIPICYYNGRDDQVVMVSIFLVINQLQLNFFLTAGNIQQQLI